MSVVIARHPFPTRTKVITDPTYDVAFESILLCDTTLNSIILNLPLTNQHQDKRYYFKKIDATINTVTVLANGTELIDGVSSIVISTPRGSLTVVSDGITWYIL